MFFSSPKLRLKDTQAAVTGKIMATFGLKNAGCDIVAAMTTVLLRVRVVTSCRNLYVTRLILTSQC